MSTKIIQDRLDSYQCGTALEEEQALREIWAHNHGLDRTHIHRQGVVLLVIWVRTGETLPVAWQAVKAWAEQRMSPDSQP